MKSHPVKVGGIPVRVRFDDNGRPLSAYALEGPRNLEHERLLTLAATTAFDAALFAAQTTKIKRDNTAAAVVSAKIRADNSAEHWANVWLELAHAEDPGRGREQLAVRARQFAAAGGIESDTDRDEITFHRARQFLDRQRSGGG